MVVEFKNSQSEMVDTLQEKMEKLYTRIEQKNNEIKILKNEKGKW